MNIDLRGMLTCLTEAHASAIALKLDMKVWNMKQALVVDFCSLDFRLENQFQATFFLPVVLVIII